MDIFTEVWNKSVDVLKAKPLTDDWSRIEARLRTLVGAKGPDLSEGSVMQDFREALQKRSKSQKEVVKIAEAQAEDMLNAVDASKAGFQDRVAMLKFIEHFYLANKKGAQAVWVVDNPRRYDKWTYDLFDGQRRADVKTQLVNYFEVFGADNRKAMFESLQLARKWSADAEAKTGKPDKNTLEKVRRWFHAEGDDEASVKASAATLSAGFKKIHAACNSNSVIFSDRPHKRASGWGDNTYASVNSGDALQVIYIFQLYIDNAKRSLFGRIPKMWLLAETVVHELSHMKVGTKDKRYDTAGLKPGPNLPSADALVNADSWGYFAADLAGALTKGILKDVLK